MAMGMRSAHGDMAHGTVMAAPSNMTTSSVWDVEPSYFTYPEHQGVLIAHIAVMILAWVLLLPISVMLSIARSKFALFVQSIFVLLNVTGTLFGIVYNARTPDLYENNSHGKLGWILAFLVTIHLLLGAISAYSGSPHKRTFQLRSKYQPVDQSEPIQDMEQYRYSRDSGHGTEISSPRTSIPSPGQIEHAASFAAKYQEQEVDEEDREQSHPRRIVGIDRLDLLFARVFTLSRDGYLLRAILIVCDTITRLILILGFVAVATGVAVYGGHFKGHEIFSGLAHFIKGGIFFWYGLLVLGRLMGCFADLGWSWNLRPDASIVGPTKARIPSAEFVESLLIFTYGSINVFLEHLGSEDGSWSATDLEHVSISIMFAGGGLCGMMIESPWVRELLDAAVTSASNAGGFGSSLESWQRPKTYRTPLNPMPAIIIMLLGKMMSSHHQASMTSTMLHSQWGGLFAVAAVARGVTYLLVFLSPPTSYFPSRPPSELVVAFCLISGGLIFMGSNSDFVTGMEMYELNAMFSFTIATSVTSFLMAWEILALAVKGWAIQWED